MKNAILIVLISMGISIFLFAKTEHTNTTPLGLSPVKTTPDSGYFKRYYIKDDLDLHTGQVTFSIPVYSVQVSGNQPISLEGSLFYDGNILTELSATNELKQSGWVGVGFKLSMMHITANTKGTREWWDDSYILVFGNGQTMKLIPVTGTIHEFQTETYSNYKIERVISGNDVIGWHITDENGILYTLGDMTANILGTKKSTVVKLAWNNWIGDGNTTGYSYAATGWYLSRIENDFGGYIDITYFQDNERIYVPTGSNTSFSTTLKFTKGIYPSTIESSTGTKVEFITTQRDVNEWLDLDGEHDEWTNGEDEYQEFYERYYLDKLNILFNKLLHILSLHHLPENIFD